MAYWDRYHQTKEILERNKRVRYQEFIARLADHFGIHAKTVEGYLRTLIRSGTARLDNGFLVWVGEPKPQWVNAPPEGRK